MPGKCLDFVGWQIAYNLSNSQYVAAVTVCSVQLVGSDLLLWWVLNIHLFSCQCFVDCAFEVCCHEICCSLICIQSCIQVGLLVVEYFILLLMTVKLELFASPCHSVLACRDIWEKKPLLIRRRSSKHNDAWFSTDELHRILCQVNNSHLHCCIQAA